MLKNNTILLSLFVSVLCLSLVEWFSYAHYTVFYCCGLLGLVFLSLTLSLEDWSPVYILRFVLILATGLVPAAMIYHYAWGTIVMNYAVGMQTKELAGRVFLLTVLALAGNAMGWALATEFVRFQSLNPNYLDREFTANQKNSYRFFFVCVALISGSVLAQSLGPFIWEVSYTMQSSGQFLGITAYNLVCTIALIALFSILISEKKMSILNLSIFAAVAIYVLLFCMLFRGMRAEVAGTVFGCFAVFTVARKKKWNGFQILSAVVGGFSFIYIWGAYRTAAASGLSLEDSVQYLGMKFESYDIWGNSLYQTGTFGDISATFFNAIALIEKQAVHLLNGQSYVDYFLRTLPAFIYPDRPRDLSFIYYETDTPYGGGIFELAEAYFNFGTVGCFIVPMIVGGALGYVKEKSVQNPSILRWIIFGTFAGSVFRGTLYQTFVFYRAATVLLFFIGLAEIYCAIESRWLFKESGRIKT